MVSLDDLPYGYVDPYEKQVKKFKPDILNNNAGANKEKAAKEQELRKTTIEQKSKCRRLKSFWLMKKLIALSLKLKK